MAVRKGADAKEDKESKKLTLINFMKELKTSELIKEYYHRKLTIQVCELTNRIDAKLKELNRLRDNLVINKKITEIDYQIKLLFKDI